MIGIIADPVEDLIVREFFELFKTPWENYRSDLLYEVVICVGEAKLDRPAARLIVVYAGDKTSFDEDRQIQIQSRKEGLTSSYAGTRLRILGSGITFRHQGAEVMVDEDSGESLAYLDRSGEQMFARVGYNLFREVHTLLTQGQPPTDGSAPTLDLHIAILRDLVVGCGIPLVEIPPAPDRYPFIVCLTHDIDHPSIRRHKLDHTTLGFLYRAVVDSVINLARGRLSFSKLLTNWSAAAKLPLVYLGLAKDFWNNFERYLDIERGHPSTFFIIPFADQAGNTPEGPAPRLRAARYDVSHIAAKVSDLISLGCEVGLHGIDAWTDSSRGREEARRVSEVTGVDELGVRMHWLYMNADSMRVLDAAGFLYDSTTGYNDAVGFRAGTTQVFKPLAANRMFELPLHIMDTALFYSGRMNLSQREAWKTLAPVLDHAVRHAGVLTINWHDRSIAPERLWEDFYIHLLNWLEDRGPWFSTATQVVGWFRRRRSVTFGCVERQENSMRVKVAVPADVGLPPMRLRIHEPLGVVEPANFGFSPGYTSRDICLNSSMDICIPLDRKGLHLCR